MSSIRLGQIAVNLRKSTSLILLLLIVTKSSLRAQTLPKHTISGTLKDKKTGETVIGGVVQILELKGVGAMTNEYGFYSITVAEGKYTVVVASIGYKKHWKDTSWEVYSQPIDHTEGDSLYVLAHRIGYKASEVVKYKQ